MAVGFVPSIYKLTKDFPKTEIYGLVSQIRRAAVSIPSNIAEGSARSSAKERIRFYEISRSSLVEVDTQLEIAMRLNYCNKSNLKEISEQMNHLFASISNLIGSIK